MLWPDYPELEYVFRLLIAGILGGLVGLEREYRSKEAGTRTHFLVALGSALLMMISQHGFADVAELGWIKIDPGRIAAQIVSGIGFLGAGIIIFHKQAVKGLTTAAGIWVAAGIGMAVGGGMYILGLVATILALAGLELLQLSSFRLGLISRTARVVFSVPDIQAMNFFMENIVKTGCRIGEFSFKKNSDGKIKVSVLLHYRIKNPDDTQIVRELEKIPEVDLENFE